MNNAALAGVETLACDVTTTPLPIADASVDCILFADVIEHFAHSPRFALQDFHRVLKPGGVCVATTPNAVRLPVRLKMLLGYSNWPPITEYFDETFHAGHHHEYTPAEFRDVFERAGFSVAEFKLFGNTGEVDKNSFDPATGASTSVSRGGNPLVGIGKRSLGMVEKFVPTLRRDMLLVARA
jgi:SAM-dependent methyltransferase